MGSDATPACVAPRGAPRDLTCLFCGEGKDESAFNREHVIPEAMGGWLVLDPGMLDVAVCCSCNSTLGSKADSEFARDGHMRLCMSELGLEGRLGEVRPIRVEASDGAGRVFGFDGDRLRPTRQVDGSLIVPGSGVAELKKIIYRDQDVETADPVARRALDDWFGQIEAAPFDGIPIEHPEFPYKLVKSSTPLTRTEYFRTEIPRRGVAKIAFEWIYLTQGVRLCSRFEELARFALSGEPAHIAQTINWTVLDNPPDSAHGLRIYQDRAVVWVDVILFGASFFKVLVGALADADAINEVGIIMEIERKALHLHTRTSGRWVRCATRGPVPRSRREPL